MKTWFSRVVVVAFFLSIVAAPYLQVSAEDVAGLPQATPIASETPIVDGPDPVGTEPTAQPEDLVEDGTAPAEGTDEPGKIDTPVGTPEASKTSVSARGIQPLALDGSSLEIYDVWFYDHLGELEVDGIVSAGAVVEPGESVNITYNTQYLTLDETPLNIDVGGSLGVIGTAQANQSTGTITITFTDGIAATDSSIYFSFDVPGTVGNFPECRDLPYDHLNYVEVEYGLPFGQSSFQWIQNDEECVGSGLPNVDWMGFDPIDQEFSLGLEIQSMPPAGHEITITYPTDRVTVSPEPVNFYRYNYTTDVDVLIATGTASGGVITITFLDAQLDEGDEWSSWSYGNFHATLNDGVCDATSGLYYQEVDEIEFVASTGLVESANIEGRLCNAASPVKSGAWNEDGTRIIWTIDTGDLMNGAWIEDIGGPGDYDFDCSTLTVTPSNPAVSYNTFFCEQDGFGVELTGADIVRATITIESVPTSEPIYSAYVNCAILEAHGGSEQDRVAAATNGTGFGGSVCAEVFPEGGGDFITKTISDDVVDSGETLTYTVTASTTSALWGSLDVIDELPEGFVVTDTSCAVTPAQFQSTPCSVLSDSIVLSASAVNPGSGLEDPTAGGVQIVLTIEGHYDVTQDTEFVNEACSERMIDLTFDTDSAPTVLSMGDPEIFGGGVICASATVTVLALVVPTETPATPTPAPATPTPAPATPTESPATPTSVPITPTATATEATVPATPSQEATPGSSATVASTSAPASAVTGLPETGNGASRSGITSMMAVTIAAATIMVVAIGIRVRSSHD